MLRYHGGGDLCNHGDFVSFYTPDFKVRCKHGEIFVPW